MGRGKSKAKHAKVARQLKYDAAPITDLEALEAELKGDQVGEDELTDELIEDGDLLEVDELDEDELDEDELEDDEFEEN
jgi:hypothetical protein